MTSKNKNETRIVPTTILTIDREAIDWKKMHQKSYIVRYELRRKEWAESVTKYYGNIHTWYKQESDYPCYLQTHDSHLYVKYSHPDEVVTLFYQRLPLPYSVVNLQDENLLPQILKLLLADFFQIDNRFVSNADFFLWATDDKDYITGLKIKLEHNWRENKNEFVISDQATRLRKLKSSNFDDNIDWKRKNRIYYGRFYTENMVVFKQLKPAQLTKKQIKEGIYELYEGSTSNRASLPFHSVKSLQSLQQTRSYLLNQFISKFVIYLNNLGLPFQQKQLHMKPMHTTTPAFMQKRQLPLEQNPIYIVDDRLNAQRHLDDFATRFCEIANGATGEHGFFIEKAETDLQPGDWILRIQDYDKDDFDPKSGVLKDWQDPKADFYTRHPDIVKQSINVNKNSERRQIDIQKNRSRNWTAAAYLDYSLPKKGELETKIEVCRNQLLLKDAILFPKDVRKRLPQVTPMTGMVFLYKQALVYYDGSDLYFMSVAKNFETASSFIRKHTGWDLVDDVLLPSATEQKYKSLPEQKDIEEATKRPFIISQNFVWEIGDANGRPLHEDLILKKRLEALEQAIPTKRFYPPQPIQGNDLFTEAQLQSYAEFLDQHVPETTISYLSLKERYGKHIKDERGNKLAEHGGFFHLFNIQNDTKYKRYLSEYLDLTFESIREDILFPVYKGIWYAPTTNHYVVGVKDSNTGDQERGHVLRRILIHQGETNPDVLQDQLVQSFFPLLEVNFIKFRNYTVIPFPFRLITMWQKEFDDIV